jgi:exosortase family protein XrtF
MNNWFKNPIVRFLLIFSVAVAIWFSFYLNLYRIDRLLGLEHEAGLEHAVSVHLAEYANLFTKIAGYSPGLNNSTNYVVTYIEGAEHTNGVWIGEPCNGIKVMGLFIIFILAFMGPLKHKLWFIPLGIAVMHTANAIRISALTIISAKDPSSLDFNHNITFQVIMYGIVFLMWWWWVQKFSTQKK